MKRWGTTVYRLLLAALLLAAGIFAERIGLVAYFTDPYEVPYLLGLIRRHLMLVGISMALATTVGLGVGILLTRRPFRRAAGVVMYIVGLGQTLPSIAVLALMMSVLGIGVQTALFALFIYSILPIARNTLAGITSVPAPMIDAARGMGMTDARILLEVELPNAMKVILTGFRVALVINIGTAALCYLIGAGGLGDLIFTGIAMDSPKKLLAGALPTTLIALLADRGCELLGRLLIPRGLREGGA
ncbi:ABC transporter permease [Kiritimatiella glycovorans]|uniref:Carnitine transport permease protein OpuCB n=1 Tax=Kiritimatiella glycovorans TaxID=1307763 RepID=A0A0G3ENE8_9BACT|nr:ABC transporter permease [Kiritimatiella glycovorans]AKJ65669.1 Carnitine transport permease protein OpuCB [Kiritimatiella glycovorans]